MTLLKAGLRVGFALIYLQRRVGGRAAGTWGQLGIELKEEPVSEPDEVDIPKIKEIIESLPEVEEEFVTPETGPILVELPKNTPIDEEPEQVVDELEPAPDLESWNETDW